MLRAQLKKALCKRYEANLLNDSRGEATIETALLVMVLSMLVVGVLDFSLAFAQKSSMSNAVRAGVQFALARHPSIGPSASTNDTVISLQNIRNAVVDAATYLTTDPGSPALDVNLFCQCPDTTPVTCVPDPGVTLPCPIRQTYMRITLRKTYDPILVYPGVLSSALNLESSGSVRLN